MSYIKVCGITNSNDLDFVCNTEINAVGFNLYSKSHLLKLKNNSLIEYK